MTFFALRNDLRLAARRLLHTPGFTLLAILILAGALAANTSMFALVDAVLLRPLPYEAPQQLVTIWSERSQPENVRVQMSNPDFFDYRDRAGSFAAMAAVGGTLDSNLEIEGDALPIRVSRATPNLFALLGVTAARGRVFTDSLATDQETTDLAVISHQMWITALAGREDVIGSTLIVDGAPWRVLGVLPKEFRLLRSAQDQGRGPTGVRPRTDVWLPAVQAPGNRGMGGHMRTLPFLSVLGRLREGVSPAEAQDELDGVAASLRAEYSEHAALGTTSTLALLQQEVVGDVRPIVVALSSLVGIVLLVACASISGMLLSRANGRTRETAIRAALGGGRWDLIRPSLAEGLLLGLAATAAGLWAGQLLITGLVTRMPASLPRMDEAQMNPAVAGATVFAALLSTLLIALLPAWRVIRTNVAPLIARSQTPPTGRRFGSLVVISEVALSTVLVLAALLMTQTLRELHDVDPGFEPDRIVSLRVSMPSGTYRRGPERIEFLDRVAAELATLPGVEVAGAVWPLPIAAEGLSTTYGANAEAVANFAGAPASYRIVTPGTMETFGLRPLRGRLVAPSDLIERARVAVVSASAATVAFGQDDPVGRTLFVNVDDVFQAELRVIGVVPDMVDGSIRAPARATVYLPYGTLTAQRNTWLVARTTTPGAMPAVRDALRRVDASVALADLHLMSDYIDDEIAPTRAATALIAAFSLFAFVLAGAGLYGAVRSQVLNRRREIGVRIALGASRARVVRSVVYLALRMALLGGAAGALVALPLNRVLASLLFSVSVAEPAAYAAVVAVLAAVALVSSYLPARHAARVDPSLAFRGE